MELLKWPNYCLLCHVETPNNNHFAYQFLNTKLSNRAICESCEAELPWNDSACFSCGIPLDDSCADFQCGECLQQPPPFKLAITPLHYHNPIAPLLRGFKHSTKLNQGKLLGEILGQQIEERYLDTDLDDIQLPQAIIPTPLHWRRFIQRGYNQSKELGHQLSRHLNLPCLDYSVKRTRHTISQQGLNKQQRLKNMQNAFAIQKPIKFKRVAILDDVVTTGTTAREIATLLLNHGVEEVHLWAVARTPLRN